MSLVTAPAHYQERVDAKEECQNCGAADRALAVCARCRSAWFCSVKCQRAYWPFHKQWCRRNDFADAVERHEPKFARWMRKHGKQAVLKDGGRRTRARARDRCDETRRARERRTDGRRDATRLLNDDADEVDRLDRNVVTQDDLYGRANPKPSPPDFDAEDMRKMRAAEEARMLAAREDTEDVAWLDIKVPDKLGLELERYKWRQNQSFVEVFVKLPRGTKKHDLEVFLSSTRLDVRVRDEVVVQGNLTAVIKAELSTWVIVDGVLEISMLKKNRRGHYDNGCSNADTFWPKLLADAEASLPLPAPSEYFSTEYEIEKDLGNNARKSSSAPMISQRR